MTATHARSESATNAAPRESALLLSEFPTLVSSEGGVARLRRLVLELAIQGRLSDAHSGDGSATPLYDEARRDRLARIEAGRARHMDELLDVSADESPWSLPSGWMWTRIGLAMNLVNGRAFKPSDWSTSGTPIIRIQNLNNPSASFNYCKFSVEPKFHLRAGDFLISWSGTPGTSFGAFIWDGPDGVLNQHIFRAEVYGNAYDLKFLRIAINARLDEMIAQAHGGVGLQHITKGKLEALPIPLPPLAEQKRIVAKVDQLMALCDELEAKQAKKRDVGDRLTKAALAALASAETPEEFRAAWRVIDLNFDSIVQNREDVALVRDAILDLGVRGRLSASQPNDTPVTDLMADIAKRQVPARRRSSSGASNEPVSPLFKASAYWGWVRLDQVTDIVGGVTKGRDLRGRKVAAFPYLRVANVQRGSLDLEQMKEIEIPVDELEKYRLKVGDVLFTEGGDWDKVGRSAVWEGTVEPCLHQNHVFRARVVAGDVEPAWLVAVANSPSGRRYFEAAAKQTTNLASINMTQLRAYPIPLPPRAEQRRILDRLHSLMALCDQLEKSLSARNARARALAEAVVATAA